MLQAFGNTIFAKTIKLSRKEANCKVQQKLKITLKNAKKMVRWSSSNKRIATVSPLSNSKYKRVAYIFCKKTGKAVITAKSSGKKYKCKIYVKKSNSKAHKESNSINVPNQSASNKSSESVNKKNSNNPNIVPTSSPSQTTAPTATTTDTPLPRYTVIDGCRIDNEGTLVSYEGNAEQLTIPSVVKTIGFQSFSMNQTLKNVIIPDGITMIDINAFNGCFCLETVKISGTVEEIDSGAFANCDELKNVSIGYGAKNIYAYAFANCPYLKELSVPSSVVDIGRNAFYGIDTVYYSGSAEYESDYELWGAKRIVKN